MNQASQLRSTELSPEQIQFYRDNGYLILRNRFSPDEVQAWQQEADQLLHADFIAENNLRTPMHQMPDGQKVVERVDPVIDVSVRFKALLFDDRILEPLRSIFGEEPVLFKDKLIFKVPRMRGYEMHQDFAWWQPQAGEDTFEAIHPDKILSVMLAIDPATRENGALELYPGYHRELLTPVGQLRNMQEAEIARMDLSGQVVATTEPGDIIVFHSLTPHSSEPNRSQVSRRQLYMTYNALSCGDAYAGQQAHYRGYVKKRMEQEEQTAEIYFQ
ncbi:phytanoyl-CoA dioxygenase family protein [Nibrella saemangeumensis]|uniref:Phytanoyl-CoA dioxygenase family protein n=1 Tax=Nibrella saemangeumensis TaxID=1084526 RepID=A0ABP8NQI3_9BACT